MAKCVSGARVSLVLGTALLLGACGGGDDAPSSEAPTPGEQAGSESPPQSPPAQPGTSTPDDPGTEEPVAENPGTDQPEDPDGEQVVENTPPTIGGTPPGAVLPDTKYVFQPEASDGDGDILHFSVQNLPAWAEFDATTGRIEGTPTAEQIGHYGDIVITATDGADDAALQAFSIEVTPVAMGSIELSWEAPTENTDGSPLTDLAGYKLYWGSDPGDLSNSVMIENPGVVSYVLQDLVPGTYYFVATAINTDGAESDPSEITSVTIT